MSGGSSGGNVAWDEVEEGPEFEAADLGVFDLGLRVDGCFTGTAYLLASSAVAAATLGWVMRWVRRDSE